MYEDISFNDAEMYFAGVMALPKPGTAYPGGTIGVLDYYDDDDEQCYHYEVGTNTFSPSRFFDMFSVDLPDLGWINLDSNNCVQLYNIVERTVRQGLVPGRVSQFWPRGGATTSVNLYDASIYTKDETLSLSEAITSLADPECVGRALNKQFALYKLPSGIGLFWGSTLVGEVTEGGALNIPCPYALDEFNRQVER